MKKTYTDTEQIGMLYDINIKQNELKIINELLYKFSDDDIKIINKVCDINFKIGFRSAAKLLK